MANDKRFIVKNGLDNNSNTITNVTNPTNAQDAATKSYVDAQVATKDNYDWWGISVESTYADQILSGNYVDFVGGTNVTLGYNSTTNTVTINATDTTYSAGAGLTQSGTVISHADTSSAANLAVSGRRYVTGLTFDTYGHVTGYSTGTETVVDTNNYVTGLSFNTTNGVLTATRSGLTSLEVDLDGRYLTAEADTLATVTGRGASTSTLSTFSGGLSTTELTVTGNLTVSGTTTIVNSETVSVADNILLLNSNITGTPTENGGIEVERGTSTNAQLLWNESTDRWVAAGAASGTLAYTSEIPTVGNATISISAGSGLTTGGSFTTNATTNSTITLAHADTSSVASLTALTGANVVSDIDVDGYGHVTAMATRTMTLADLGYTGATNATVYQGWTLKVGGSSKGIITNNEAVNISPGANVSLGYSSTDNTITINAVNTTSIFVQENTSGTLTNLSEGEILRFINGGATTVSVVNQTNPTVQINHADTSTVGNLTASGRRYVTGLTFDGYGHVTGYTTGTETVVNTDTNTTSLPVKNSAGTTQFIATDTSGIRFAGSGATTVSFDDATQTVTFSSTDTNTNTTYTGSKGITLSGTDFRLTGNEIPGSVDLNTYRTTGYYAQTANADAASGTNYPTANAGILQVINDDYGNGLHTTQLYSQYSSTNYYIRTYYNGTWTAWRNLSQDIDTNVYVTGASFNTTNGVLTLTRNSGSVAVDLDGRYTDNAFADTMNQHVRTTDSPTFANVTATNFNGTATFAKYADVAERYETDGANEAGTIMVFGGDKEVTASTKFAQTKVAGVISDKPAFAMNSEAGSDETHPYIALQGRVPCKVVGKVRKGDIIVASEYEGVGQSWSNEEIDPRMTAYVGIAIADKDTESVGLIEVKVGK